MSTSATTTATKPVVPTGCCPPFDASVWDGKELVWKDKLFVRDHVRAIFHVPLNMGRTITRDSELIAKAQAAVPDPLIMSSEESSWGTDIFIPVSRDVPGARMERLSGTFFARVFTGPYRDAGKWMKAITDEVALRGRKLEKIYSAYATCPKCAKAYGRNDVVLLAKITPAQPAVRPTA